MSGFVHGYDPRIGGPLVKPKRKTRPKAQHPQVAPSVNRGTYPLHNPLDRGWGVRNPYTSDTSVFKRNGRITNQVGTQLDFWVVEVEARFEMAGSTAQSRRMRQFFPHNLVQPSFIVRGQNRDSFSFNNMAAFVRDAQVRGIAPGFQVVRLDVAASTSAQFPYDGPNVKGTHAPLALAGYIRSIQAGAQKEDHAPDFEFEFMISETLGKTLWDDTAVVGEHVLSWMDQFKKAGKSGLYKRKNARPQKRGAAPPGTTDATNGYGD